MKIKRNFTAFILAVVMIFTGTVLPISAETDSETPNWFETPEAVISAIAFVPSEIEITSGNTSRLTVFSDAGKAINLSVNFTSSDPDIVSVDYIGNITAVSSGTAEVTAALKTDASITAKCTVSVKKEVPPLDPILTLSAGTASLYIGNRYAITAVSNYPVEWSSSDPSVANVSNGIVTASSAGKTVITASNGYNTATCTVTVSKGNTVNISASSSTVSAGKTLFLSSSTTGAVWKSTNTDIATVKQMTDKYGKEFAFVLAKKAGTVAISVSTSSGSATCLLTVTEPDPIRFAYTTPNSATIGSTVNFIAITDLERTAVKFEYTLNGTTSTINANSRIVEGNTAVWTGSASLKTAGTYSVKAYSKTDDTDFITSADGETTAFVTGASNVKATSCETRRLSDAVMPMFASWEGFRSDVELDNLTGSDPTVGYGRVVTVGSAFYNSLTEREAMAYLYKTVNEAGFADAVNNFMLKYGIRFNQQQYDSLVCYVYNFGIYSLENFDDVKSLLLSAGGSPATPKVGDVGRISGTDVRLRSGPSTSHSIITVMNINTQVTLISAVQYADGQYWWYNVRLNDGREGYVRNDLVAFDSMTGGTLDLNNISKSKYIQTMMPYHHASGVCLWGLIYRRVDEIEMFFEGDYIQDGKNNKYGYKFTCSRNPSTSIG